LSQEHSPSDPPYSVGGSRLSRSPYAGDFVLKGGMLLAAFGHRRPTSDADALAQNLASDVESVMARVV